MKENKRNYSKIFVYVFLVVFAISILIPIAWVMLASLKDQKDYAVSVWNLPTHLHWDNFRQAWVDARMGEYLGNSVIVTFLGIGFLLLLAVPSAYVLSRYKFKGEKIMNTMYMAGLFINVNYIAVPIFLILLNIDVTLQSAIGFRFLLNNRVVLALIYAVSALPFTIYLLSNYFKTLPTAFEEAAQIDGYSHFQIMTRIMIPLARPSIVTVILFNFLSFWNEYILALTLMPSRGKTLPVGLINLINAGKTAPNYGRLYAGLVIVMLPTLILYIIVQKKLIEGMTVGGIKD